MVGEIIPMVTQWRRRWRLGWAGLALAWGAAGSAFGESARVDFAAEIQPIFQASCAECHDGRKQKSGFRLDVRRLALKGGESGQAAVAPGRPEESPLYLRVAALEGDGVMPPKGERLPAAQVALLRRWIAEGAEWPDSAAGVERDPAAHWAFHAPVAAPAPGVARAGWAANDLDRFILARLEGEGLGPAPEADRVTLLRRLSFDLTGLPPSVEEVEAFAADSSPEAWRRQVERLLESPHYGEKWGRQWLDAARYADSDGFEKDMSRSMWPYRDYVVGALNRDMPYNQFVVEQVAGDLLPGATQEQRVATGFLRNSMRNEEGGVDPEQFRMESMFDRMDALGKSVLGLTIQCAQCHNHKFDPISQEEYYKLFAYVNNDDEPTMAVYSREELALRREIFLKIAALEGVARAALPDWEARLAAWEREAAGGQPEWTVVQPVVEDISTGGQRYIPLEDGSFLAQGYKPTFHMARMEIAAPVSNITAFRLELLTDANLPFGGPGRSFMGTSALTEFMVEAPDPADPAKMKRVKFAEASADVAQPERVLEPNFDDKSNTRRVTGPVAYAIDGDDKTAWGIDTGPGRRNVPRKAVFTCAEPVAKEPGAKLVFLLKQDHGGWNSDDHMNNNLGRFRLSVAAAPNAKADPLPARVREALAVAPGERSLEDRAAIFSHWRTTVPELADINARVEAEWARHPVGASTMTLAARTKPRATKLLSRGDWLKPGREVVPGTPAFLPPMRAPEGTPPRLALARWLVSDESPTAARVAVNRVWQAYFGTGLLETPEDFGMQAPAPSHPELLDWLAVEFMRQGWSMKQLHRLITTSATYRQSSRVTPESYARDQYNRLLARGPRFRLEGEGVRDAALAASGLLNRRLGGPSVFAPAPAFLFMPPASYGPFTWTEATGAERYRRALYTFRRRSTPYPALQVFDTPNGDFSCVRRPRSNTPTQALTSLNETVFMECAQALAREILARGGGTDPERLAYGFRRVLSRAPEPDEVAVLQGLLERQRARVADGWVSAAELATGKAELPADLPPGTNPTQLAAYAAVSRALLNLDEAITKE